MLEWVGMRRGLRSVLRVGRGSCLFRNFYYLLGLDLGVIG